MVVLLTTAGSLLFLEYVAVRPAFLCPRPIPTPQLARWSFLCFLAYFVVPALVVRLVLRRNLSDVGLTLRGFARHAWLYAVLFLLVTPLVYLASVAPDFQQTYPFADSARDGVGPLVTWELIYGLQFFSLEFFFRGFMVFCLAERFGRNAIFVMVVPYMMIHFHKPWPEAMGAVGAGLVLGYVALRTRSIFGGVAIHWAVAISMDVMAILRTGGFR